MPSPGTDWQIEVHDTIEPVLDAWRLLLRPDNSTPFQTGELLQAFYRQLAINKEARPVIALARFPDGRPAAGFAMWCSRRDGLNWLHTSIRPIDYGNPVFDRSIDTRQAQEIVKAMLAAVPNVDLAYFNKMPAHFHPHPNPLVGPSNSGELRVSSWFLPLAGRSEEDLMNAQSRNFRRNLGRRVRKMEKDFDRKVTIKVGKELTDQDFADIQALHAERTGVKERISILSDPDWEGYYASIARSETAPCLPWLTRLECDGELIAMLFGLFDGPTVVSTMVAMKSGDWEGYSPGQQVFRESILFFSAAGAEMFDMSIGDMSYKHRFGCERMPLHDAMFPKTLSGHAYYAFWRAKIAIRSRLKAEPVNEHD